MRYLSIKSFRLLNPNWDIILYTSEAKITDKTWTDPTEQDFHTYSGDDYFNYIHDLDVDILEWSPDLPDMGPSHLSNFLKWHKLYAHGGVYSDMDILWVKPFDDLFTSMQQANTAICCTEYLSIGLLGSTIGNNFYRDLYNNAKSVFNKNKYQSVGVINIYRMLYGDEILLEDGDIFWAHLRSKNILDDIQNKYPDCSLFNIPMDIVYPFTHSEMTKVFCENHKLPEQTLGIHWYAGNPISQEYNIKLTPDNIHKENTTFGKAACNYA